MRALQATMVVLFALSSASCGMTSSLGKSTAEGLVGIATGLASGVGEAIRGSQTEKEKDE